MDIENALVWGIKSSWTDYVERMSDGTVTTSGGAERLVTGEFAFPLVQVGSCTATFTGTVEFSGHYGMLSVRFAEPAITSVDGLLELSIIDDDPEAPDQRRTILTLGDPSQGANTWQFNSPVLTSAGADLFFDNYRPGTRFDSVVVPSRAMVVQCDLVTSCEPVNETDADQLSTLRIRRSSS